jgi:Zn-dependent protease with chaperone function
MVKMFLPLAPMFIAILAAIGLYQFSPALCFLVPLAVALLHLVTLWHGSAGVCYKDESVNTVVRAMAFAMDVYPPRVFIYESNSPNAYVNGIGKKTVLYISTYARDNLSKSELKAVIAHELSHLRSSDPLVNCVFIGAFGIAITSTISMGTPLHVALLEVTVFAIFWFMRNILIECAADNNSAAYCGSSGMISFLSRFNSFFARIRVRSLQRCLK